MASDNKIEFSEVRLVLDQNSETLVQTTLFHHKILRLHRSQISLQNLEIIFLPLFIVDAGKISMDDSMVWTQV